MDKSDRFARIITRRDSLKVVLLPATTALTTRFLIGCAGDHAGSADMPSVAQPGSSVGQAGALGAAPVGGSAPSVSSSPVAGRASAANSSSAAPAAASGGAPASASAPASATAGQPATMSMPPAVAGAAAPSSAGAGGAHAAGSGGSVAMVQAGAGGAVATGNVMWASGGTKAMQGNYPDPFSAGMMGKACTLYPSQTIGPCYADGPMMRQDISDGLTGLPMRLSFLLVGKDGCAPISNATIDIWHSGSQGIYSAYATGTTCNPGMDDVKSKMFCRGVQTTNESGRVDFSSVFPGWYRGRTIHVHFTVRLNGKEAVTSQLYFDDALVDEILAQGEYKARGKRDTNNTKDGIFKSGGATADQVVMSTAKRADGVLHAWKVLAIG